MVYVVSEFQLSSVLLLWLEVLWLDAPAPLHLRNLIMPSHTKRSLPCIVALVFAAITQDQAAFADQMPF